MVFLIRPNEDIKSKLAAQSSLHPKKSAWRITLTYAISGLVWVFFSDQLVSLIFAYPMYLAFVHTAKGWLYVLATSFLLFSLIHTAFANAQKHQNGLSQSYHKLQILHEKLKESEWKAQTQLEASNRYQARLQHLAYYDALTNLPNRLSLQKDLEKLRENKQTFALMFMDLDNFKDINDFKSHKTGDFLLQQVAERLENRLQPPTKVYRFGGDEFIILAPLVSEDLAIEAARNLVLCFQEPFSLIESLAHLTPSVGLVYCDDHQIDFSELIKHADLAMYESKRRGGNCFSLFSKQLIADNIDRMLLEERVRNLWQNNQLCLFYQPVVNTTNQRIFSFEALLRWEPWDYIDASVEHVVEVFEATGLILPVSEWILREACLFLKKISELGFEDTQISVNISIVQFSHCEFAQTVQTILTEVGIEPKRLCLEITESVFMESYELVQSQIEPLQKLGVQIALDDFGKGYSSLSYLKMLPLNTLKIDKSFLDQVTTSKKDALLASHIMAIGNSFDLQIVAEGVETEEQRRFLMAENCHSFQGYLYSPPVSQEKALQLLQQM